MARGLTGVAALADLVRGARSLVALTGAGISVPSGIPDFRTPGTGLWANVDPMEVAHIDAWRRDPERFWRFYGHRFHVLEDKEPNAAHAALVALERRGDLQAVVTQNIDMLHRKAGTETLFKHALSWAQGCYPEPHTEVEAEDYESGRAEDRARLVKALGYDPDKGAA